MSYAFLDDETCRRIARYIYELLQQRNVEIEPADQFMNANETAKFLHTTPAAVRMMCKRDQIPFHKKGYRYVFSKNEISKFLIKN